MSLVTIPEASKWATGYLEKRSLPDKYFLSCAIWQGKKAGENGSTLVNLNDLKNIMNLYNKNVK